MRALFAVFVILILIYAVFSVIKRKTRFDGLIRIVSAFSVCVVGVASLLFDTAYTSLCIGASLMVALSLFLRLYFSTFEKSKTIKDIMIFASKSIAVLLVIEVLVFNFNTFHLWFSDYEREELSIDNASVTGLSLDSQKSYTTDGDNPATIEFKDINKPVGTIYLDLSSTGYKADYSVDFCDETNSSYYMRSGLVKGSWFNEIEDSKYIVCHFSGAVKSLKITVQPLEGHSVTISPTVVINEDYPATFSALRFFTFLLGLIIIRLFIKAGFMHRSVKSQMQMVKSVTAFVLIVCVIFMLFMTLSVSNGAADFKLTLGNQITKELVDAFEDGRVTLDTPVSKELLDLQNPYDWSQREENGVNALWDHVLYNGKYYSYYGVGPVVLLFLPYHMLTGYYFPSCWATFLFSAVGLVMLGLLFMELVKRFFDDTELCMYLSGLVMLLVSCGVWYCLIPSNFYEIAQASGFCFVALGAYFLITSNILNEGKIKLFRLMLSSLFLSIAVTCRPTTAVWCVVSLLFIGYGAIRIYKDNKAEKQKKSFKKIATYLLSALVPFAVIGSLQMIYNYVRFSSFTDFGIQYSLTINDFIHAQYHTQMSAIGFYNYLFAPPSFSAEFPYVMSNVSNLGVNGYYFIATQNGCGLLFRALPVFALFLSPYALKYVKKEYKTAAAVLFIATAIVAPFVVIHSVWESGYGVRYMIDFAWQMLVCALFVIYIFYRHTKHEETKRLYRYMMVTMMILCIIVNFSMYYSYIYPGYNTPAGYENSFEIIKRAFTIFNT